MKRILTVAFLFVCGIARAGNKDTLQDVYKGNLPCPDCKAVHTTLILRHEKNADDGLFMLKEVHEGGKAGNKSTEIKGSWTVLRGDATDRNATVIELTNTKTDKALRHYLRRKDGSIQMLDYKLRAIKTKGNYVLRKN